MDRIPAAPKKRKIVIGTVQGQGNSGRQEFHHDKPEKRIGRIGRYAIGRLERADTRRITIVDEKSGQGREIEAFRLMQLDNAGNRIYSGRFSPRAREIYVIRENLPDNTRAGDILYGVSRKVNCLQAGSRFNAQAADRNTRQPFVILLGKPERYPREDLEAVKDLLSHYSPIRGGLAVMHSIQNRLDAYCRAVEKSMGLVPDTLFLGEKADSFEQKAGDLERRAASWKEKGPFKNELPIIPEPDGAELDQYLDFLRSCREESQLLQDEIRRRNVYLRGLCRLLSEETNRSGNGGLPQYAQELEKLLDQAEQVQTRDSLYHDILPQYEKIRTEISGRWHLPDKNQGDSADLSDLIHDLKNQAGIMDSLIHVQDLTESGTTMSSSGAAGTGETTLSENDRNTVHQIAQHIPAIEASAAKLCDEARSVLKDLNENGQPFLRSGRDEFIYRKMLEASQGIVERLETEKERNFSDEEEKSAHQNIFAKHGVRYLYHFTRIENLEKILKYGLLTRETLDALKNMNEMGEEPFTYQYTDEKRLDAAGRPETPICTTVSAPNYTYLFAAGKKDPEHKWVILKLYAPQMIIALQHAYAPSNAAACSGRLIVAGSEGVDLEPEGEKRLFPPAIMETRETRTKVQQDALNSKTKFVINRSPDLKDCYTTDPQAEVLIREDIPPVFIEGVIFEDEEDLRENRSMCESYGIDAKHRSIGSWFGTRPDEKCWKTVRELSKVDDIEVLDHEVSQEEFRNMQEQAECRCVLIDGTKTDDVKTT